VNNKDPITEAQDRESRRDMLLKIGAALAVASVPIDGMAQTPARQAQSKVVRIPANITRPFSPKAEKQTFSVFFSHPGGTDASVLVIPASDQRSVREATNLLRGEPPATATIVGGVIHVNLGRAAAGRCTMRDVTLSL
jgi:hypothetical protein